MERIATVAIFLAVAIGIFLIACDESDVTINHPLEPEGGCDTVFVTVVDTLWIVQNPCFRECWDKRTSLGRDFRDCMEGCRGTEWP